MSFTPYEEAREALRQERMQLGEAHEALRQKRIQLGEAREALRQERIQLGEAREALRQERIQLAVRRKAHLEHVIQCYESGEVIAPTSAYATVTEAISDMKRILRDQEQLLQELQKTDSS